MDIKIKKATKNDNLKEIAQLIYETDPFIYPFWFDKNIEEAISVLRSMILAKGTIFNYGNCLIAKSGEKVVGLLVYIDENKDLSNDCKKWKNTPNADYAIENYIKPLKSYQITDSVYISNVAVLKEYRRQHIASRLLEKLFSLYPTSSFMLHCLGDNAPAIKLYQKEHFEISKQGLGFNGPGKTRPKVYAMTKNKNATPN